MTKLPSICYIYQRIHVGVAAFSQKFNNIRALGIQSSISCSMHCVNFLSVVFWVAGFIFIVCKEIGGAIG